MRYETLIGIDPGKRGGIAWRNCYERQTKSEPMPETPRELIELLREIVKENGTPSHICVYLENVVGNAGGCKTAQQGLSFGRGYGHLEMACMALGFTIEDVRPQKWQAGLSLGSKGKMSDTEWKRKLRAMAERVFPGVRITNATADALLILHYAIKQERQNYEE